MILSFLMVYSVVFWFLLAGPFVGYETTEMRNMTWAVQPPWPSTNGQGYRVVTLSDPGGPIESFTIESDLIAHHVQTLGGPTVEVELELTKDYGEVRAYMWRRVGEISYQRVSREEARW